MRFRRQSAAYLEAERDALVTEAAPSHPNANKIKALAALRSIGAEFTTMLVGEVLYRSFDNPPSRQRSRIGTKPIQ